MRLRWFKLGLIALLLVSYIFLAKYIRPAVASLLLSPLKFCEGVSSNARQFLRFQDTIEENKRLKNRINGLTGQLLQLQEAALENQRLRGILSLPQKKALTSCAAFVVAKDSSNWTSTVIINKGKSSGIRKGMPVILEAALVGKVIEAGPITSKVALLVDFNSKIAARIVRTREEGVVYGTVEGTSHLCKMKYIQGEIKIGDTIISSGLGGIYPKGLLIGQVIAVAEEENRLYETARIKPAVDFLRLEEVAVITTQ